jgi:hypothetical protein
MRGTEIMRTLKRKARWGFGPVLVGCLAIIASGCDLEVVNPGAITDASLDDASLMGVVANGVSNEFIGLVDGINLDVVRLTDEAAGTGSYFQTGRLRRGALDWTETDGNWAQAHEAIWTGRSAWERMTKLESYDQTSSEDAARVWLLTGLANRMYGETFCQVVYSVGPTAEEPVRGGLQNRTAAFDTAIVHLQRAIDIATAANTAYSTETIIPAATAGIAQAYAGKGDFATAVTYSGDVDTDFVYEALFNRNANDNEVYFETVERAEIGLFNTYAGTLAEQDPRVPYTICGTFDDPANPKDSDVTPTNAEGCTAHQGADGTTAHYMQQKYPDYGSDVPVATGVDMRLIEAEAAIMDNDMTAFKTAIDAVRDQYGLDPLTAEPASAGSLEYPNAYNANTGDVSDPGVDAWSILDAERLLTTWGEARRHWDLHRWNHPFLDGGIVFWDAEDRRASCYPVPEDECQLNDNLSGQTLLTGVGDETMTCS